jgi:predicted dehydrogenase
MRVGIIGTGWGCSVQVPFFRQAGLEVVAIYSRDLSKARRLCEDLEVPHAFDSVAALLACADADVELVSVVSPTFLHAEHALAALRAGKHVLTDKPMALNAAQAVPLVAAAAAAAAAGQIALVDHELRFLRCVQAARAWVVEGAIGALRHASASFLVNMRGLGRTHSWWHERARGGGVSGALGVHVVDLLHFVTGRRLARVAGRASTFLLERPGGTATADDAFTIDGAFAAPAAPAAAPAAPAAVASIVVDGLASVPAERRLVLLGSEGAVVLDLVACTATRFDKKGREAETVAEEDEDREPEPWEMAAPDAFVHGTFAIGQALARSGGDPRSPSLAGVGCSFADGAYVAAVMDAMRASSDGGGARRKVVVVGGAQQPLASRI